MPEAELEALTRSIAEFGCVEPIVARRSDGVVIGGHQRLVCALRLGLGLVPVVYVDLSDDRSRLLSLALNRIRGEWDESLLARLLSELRAGELDVLLSGFGQDEIDGLLRRLDASARRERTEDFDLEEALQLAGRTPRARRGDVWVLRDHRLACGDATEPSEVGGLLDGSRARMAFVDPPYNVDYGTARSSRRGGRRPILHDQLSEADWRGFCRGWTESLVRSVDGALYVAMSSKEWPTVTAILAEVGAHWSDTIVWAKDRFVLGRSDYQRQYEPIWYGWPAGTERFWCGDRDQGDVWSIPRPSVSPLHPTMKPLALVEKAIENSSRPGDVVLDLFLGSGTTLIAAERTGRRCLGLELDPLYVDVAIARWERFSGETAVRA